MSFTFEQCKDFKRWGYPQDGEAKYVDHTLPITGLEGLIGASYAIPTLEGVMEWLKGVIGDYAVVLLQTGVKFPDGKWFAEAFDDADEESPDFTAYGATAHEAIYNLAKKVKGE